MRVLLTLFAFSSTLYPLADTPAASPGQKELFTLAKQERSGARALGYYQQTWLTDQKGEYAEEACFRVGQYYYAKGDYAPAIRMFDSLLAGFPSGYFKSEALFWKGVSYLSSGNKDSAKILLAGLTEEDPAAYVRGQVVLGILLARDSGFAESNRCLERALTLGDNSLRSTIYFQLFRNYSAMGEEKRAAVYAKKLKEEFPESLEVPGIESEAKKIAAVITPAGPVAKEEYVLQLGAFQSRDNAERLRKKYKDSYEKTEVSEIKRNNASLYVVRLGRFKTIKDAQSFAALELDLSEKEYKIIKQ